MSFITSQDHSLNKGVSVAGLASDESKTFLFDATHRLVGFKGLVQNKNIHSIGVIIFDSNCNLQDPLASKREDQGQDNEALVLITAFLCIAILVIAILSFMIFKLRKSWTRQGF